MLTTIFFFVASVAVLWASSELVTRNISPISRRLGITELAVTILGVSVFSSLPELSVSALAALRNNADISVGNVVGSNFVTITFVTAVCALITPINMRRQIRDRESSWMILSTVVILVLALDRTLSRIDGCILMALYVPYLVSVLREMRDEARGADPGAGSAVSRRPLWVYVAIEAAAIAGIIFSARVALNSGMELGRIFAVPDMVLGAIFFAFGTSLPELAIAVSATVRKKADVTMGEIYASNIFTALAVLGICCVIRPLVLTDPGIFNVGIPFLILGSVIVQIFITTNMVLNRVEALAMLALYAYFVIVQMRPDMVPWRF